MRTAGQLLSLERFISQENHEPFNVMYSVTMTSLAEVTLQFLTRFDGGWEKGSFLQHHSSPNTPPHPNPLPTLIVIIFKQENNCP